MTARPRDRRSFLTEAPEALRGAFDDAAVALWLSAGATLFTQGERADAFYILDEGEVEISVLSPGGRKLSLEIMTRGEIFGEIGLFAGQRTATATAIGAVRLRRIGRADLMARLRVEPDLALQVIDLLCDRLRTISAKLEERAFLPLPTRLASRLLHLGAKLSPTDGVIPVSQADLADFAGATREAVAKTLGAWKAAGWVVLSRGAVTIRDKAALQAIAAAADD
jgi:CRP-like cAMP-binding protein